MTDFEESEYRGPLFNQLEQGTNLLWEPGQVFEKTIGIDRASFCFNNYLWNLHGYNSSLGGSILQGRPFRYIWSTNKPRKVLPDFKLNLFIQAKRSTYSSRTNVKLRPNVIGPHWYFKITNHQQLALEKLEKELSGEALVIYAAPLFHKQQELYNHTSNKTIVGNSTFPKASMLAGHSKWYYNKPGIIGFANPDFEFFSQDGLIDQVRILREKTGNFDDNKQINNLEVVSKAIRTVVETRSDDFEATRFAYYTDLIDYQLERDDLGEVKGLKDFLQIETFAYLWKLNWLTF